MVVVRVRVQQINEVGVVKMVEFFVHVFAHDVNDQKQHLSVSIYHIYRFVLQECNYDNQQDKTQPLMKTAQTGETEQPMAWNKSVNMVE